MRLTASRRVLGGGVLAGVVIVVACLAALLSGPVSVPGTPSATGAADLARSALGQLGGLGDVRLRGSLTTESGVDLAIDVVALSGGRTTATVSDGAGGAATFLAVRDRVVVNANSAWWLNTVPVYAQSLSDTWVHATDDMGFPVGMLTALSGARLREVVDGSSWTARPTVYVDGTRAFALSAHGSPWTIYLSSENSLLLGIGGPLAGMGDRLRKAQTGGAYSSGLVSTTAVDDPCRERANKTVTDAGEKVASAPEPPPVPAAGHGPDLSIDIVATGTCMTASCPTPVAVVNSGDEAATGMLSVTATSGGGGVLPFTVAPGQRSEQVFQVVNPAYTCTQSCTRPYDVSAFAQVTTIAGGDLDTGRRLYDKGVDPNRPVPGRPEVAGPDVNSVIDRLITPGPAVAGFARAAAPDDPAVERVIDLVQKSGDARLLSLLRTLARHPAIAVADGQPSPVIDIARSAVRGKGAERLAARQQLALLADLAQQPGRSPNSLSAQTGLVTDTFGKRVYSIASVTNPDDRDRRVHTAADEALKRFATVETTGLAKTLVLDFGDAFPAYGQVQRKVLVDQLSLLRVDGRSLADLLGGGTDTPVVDELMVANKFTRDSVPGGRYVFTRDDLTAFLHRRPADIPRTKPAGKDLVFTEPNVHHMAEGDPYDAADPGKQNTGGHLAGAGGPGKTEFPAAWTLDDVKAALAQVADQGRTVDSQGNLTTQPRADRNHMNAPVWSWRYLGTATVKGITVEIDMYVYSDGTFRNAYPALRAGGPNRIVDRDRVHVAKSATLNDTTLFKNPDNPPANPQLNGARTLPPRYDRATDTWRYPALDATGKPAVDQAGQPVTYVTDNAGVRTPTSPIPVAGCP
ncbi:EndoU domain-containing protein [Actinokineospora enzanensis]|uniref:EndoU domain-containing protein n=1 Tax=Actinokineospora enzanensis TaxID=155975 RepID=UPI0003671C95|nr:EndoU domain-containing protein [Actinokineospora enzanensis]